jgi:hypothetical protein
MFYAGIGSRETPLTTCQEMSNIAMQLAIRGLILRSGRAKRPVKPTPNTDSADLAFEKGCDIVSGAKVIRTSTIWQPAVDHAAKFHPNWGACNEYAQSLHARNSLIMVGDSFVEPVSFVVCWMPGGAIKGGTGQALRIADSLQIPVWNLAICSVDQFWSWFNESFNV